MTIKTSVKAGKIITNHTETLVVRTNVKAGEGGLSYNHNESFRR